MVTLLGIPNDENSSFLRGPASAPPLIREALRSDSANMWAESGIDLGNEPRLDDAGDLEESVSFERIEAAIGEILDRGERVLSLGGDHAIAYPIQRAYGPRHPGLTVLQIDAHPDLYDELDGNRLSHACPFARIMEEGLVASLVQVGIRTLNGHQREQAERFGVEIHEMRHGEPQLSLQGPLYLSLDLDALDPAFAPGVSHHEPGGFSVRQVITLIQNLPGPLVGADLVEYNPSRDPSGVTGMVAAKLLKEIAAKMLDG